MFIIGLKIEEITCPQSDLSVAKSGSSQLAPLSSRDRLRS